jgi:hypothetical protein
MSRSKTLKIVLSTVAMFALAAPASAPAKLSSSAQKAAEKAGYDAYIYGYAPVDIDKSVSRFPQNTVLNIQYLATELTRSIVKPNADTLYTIMVLDVGTDPVIVHTPATGSRYFGLELLDSYTNVFGYIGSRSTGTTGGDFAIVGPNWTSSKNPLKKSVKKVLQSSTPRVWVIGRTLVDDQADVSNVVALQNQITAQRNSAVGTSTFLSRLNLKSPTAGAPQPMPSPNAAFFKDFGTVTKAQPPLAADKTLLTALKKYGIGPGLDPAKTQKADVMAALVKGAVAAQAKMDATVASKKAASLTAKNGWILFDGVGVYKTDYLTRAVIAEFGLGANVKEEALYPAAVTDYSGNTLNGANGAVYRIHFAPGQTPATTNAFWSITLYAQDQYFVANSINRFAIGDRTPGIVTNQDGSTDFYISAAQPSSAQHGAANWLPAPAAQFNLMLRIYRPTAAVLNGTWKYPKIEKIS